MENLSLLFLLLPAGYKNPFSISRKEKKKIFSGNEKVVMPNNNKNFAG